MIRRAPLRLAATIVALTIAVTLGGIKLADLPHAIHLAHQEAGR